MVTRRKKQKGPRAGWRGMLHVDLVTLDVQAYNAVDPDDCMPRFHQLHAPCYNRIRYQKVYPVHGVVENNENVSGYEYSRGQYVEIDPDELERLETKADKALTVDAFVDPEQIDPSCFDGRVYYLAPDGPEAEETYGVLATAMHNSGKYAIGQVIFSQREQLVLLRPVDGVLMMQMLRHKEEVRAPAEVGIKRLKASPKGVNLAEALIENDTARRLDLAEYEDRCRNRVMRLIEMKMAGKEVVAPEEEQEPEVVNLMEALQQSIAKSRRRPAVERRTVYAPSVARRKRPKKAAGKRSK